MLLALHRTPRVIRIIIGRSLSPTFARFFSASRVAPIRHHRSLTGSAFLQTYFRKRAISGKFVSSGSPILSKATVTDSPHSMFRHETRAPLTPWLRVPVEGDHRIRSMVITNSGGWNSLGSRIGWFQLLTIFNPGCVLSPHHGEPIPRLGPETGIQLDERHLRSALGLSSEPRAVGFDSAAERFPRERDRDVIAVEEAFASVLPAAPIGQHLAGPHFLDAEHRDIVHMEAQPPARDRVAGLVMAGEGATAVGVGQGSRSTMAAATSPICANDRETNPTWKSTLEGVRS